MTFPTDHRDRKNTPLYSGVVKYFPDALREVARVSKAGNDQHNPGQPLHWAKEKSTDHEDCIVRHLADHASGEERDTDGQLHLAKVAWRALAALQTHLEEAGQAVQTHEARKVASMRVSENVGNPGTLAPYRFCENCGDRLELPAPPYCLYPRDHG